MTDKNGNEIKIGDCVEYISGIDNFIKVGIIIRAVLWISNPATRKSIGPYADYSTSKGIVTIKNITGGSLYFNDRMNNCVTLLSDEKAMLWKLENYDG